MTKTYLLYTDHYDTLKASLYVEMGEVTCVPRKGERITIDDKAYTVLEVVWDVFSQPPNKSMAAQYPQQCATVVVR